jgi:hypothetical protein
MEEASLTIDEFGIKAQSKTEVYQLLTTEGKVYLPPMKEAGHKYISQVVRGEKLVSQVDE